MTASVELGRDEWIEVYTVLAGRGLTTPEVAEEMGCSTSSIRQRLKSYGMKSLCVGAKERARKDFLDEYESFHRMGLSAETIATRLGYSSVKGLNRRVRECGGVRALSAAELYTRSLVEEWIARGVRFSRFDFPEWITDSEADFVVKHFLDEGRIVRLGPKSLFGVTWSMFGPADG